MEIARLLRSNATDSWLIALVCGVLIHRCRRCSKLLVGILPGGFKDWNSGRCSIVPATLVPNHTYQKHQAYLASYVEVGLPFLFAQKLTLFTWWARGGAPAVASGPKDKHLSPRFPPLFSTCLTFGMPKYPRKVSQSQKATLPEKGQFQK